VALSRAGAWGNLVFPLPLREGQALPRAGAWGTRGCPYPCVRA